MKRGVLLVLIGVITVSDARSEETVRTGAVAGKVTIGKARKNGAAAANAVVYLVGVPGDPDVPTRPARIRQKDLRFLPELTVVVKGTTVEFPNDDRIAHNVFSASRPARDLDLGEYKRGESRSYTFMKTGVVDLYCNIHPDMAAKVLVVDNPHFARTDANGAFRIANVPPGTYTIVAWYPGGSEVRSRVTIEGGRTVEQTFQVEEGEPPTRHLRKDGTPYGRY